MSQYNQLDKLIRLFYLECWGVFDMYPLAWCSSNASSNANLTHNNLALISQYSFFPQ